MAPANNPGFRPSGRLDRAIRTVLVAAFAALIGLIAGGASVFAIVSALTSPPRHDISADAALQQSTTAPSVPAPAQAPPPVSSQKPSPAQSSPEDRAQAASPAERPALGTPTEEPNKGGGNEINAGRAHAARTRPHPSARSARKMDQEKRRDAGTSRSAPTPDADAAEVPRDQSRPLFDLFGDANVDGGPDAVDPPAPNAPAVEQWPQANSRARREVTKPHVVRRWRRDDDIGSDPRPHRRVIVVPAPPEYSDRQGDDRQGGFFGLFN